MTSRIRKLIEVKTLNVLTKEKMLVMMTTLISMKNVERGFKKERNQTALESLVVGELVH